MWAVLAQRRRRTAVGSIDEACIEGREEEWRSTAKVRSSSPMSTNLDTRQSGPWSLKYQRPRSLVMSTSAANVAYPLHQEALRPHRRTCSTKELTALNTGSLPALATKKTGVRSSRGCIGRRIFRPFMRRTTDVGEVAAQCRTVTRRRDRRASREAASTRSAWCGFSGRQRRSKT
jgi:hypothetical protein